MSQRTINSHLLVIIQLSAIALICYPPGWSNHGPKPALLIVVLGIALGLYVLWHNRPGNFSIYPEIKSDARLITSGPYRYIRHPMYLALLLIMTGIAIYNGHMLNFVALPVLIIVLILKIRREEQLLPTIFSDYAAYQARTWRLLPGLY